MGVSILGVSASVLVSVSVRGKKRVFGPHSLRTNAFAAPGFSEDGGCGLWGREPKVGTHLELESKFRTCLAFGSSLSWSSLLAESASLRRLALLFGVLAL